MVIAGVDLHQQGGIFIHRLAIIFRMGAVGGTHFMQRTARLAHHVRDAKRAANLHQLTAGHHHLFAAGGGRQHQQHRCGVVVHNAGIFRAGQLAQQLRQRAIAMPAPGAVQIVLQRHRRSHGLHHGVHRLFRLLRASQIGMQHGSRQVNHRAQRALRLRLQPLFNFLLPRTTPDGQGVFCLNMAPGFVLKQT